jgi:hypothetical protein
MIGLLAERKLLRQAAETSLDADILPGWELGTSDVIATG